MKKATKKPVKKAVAKKAVKKVAKKAAKKTAVSKVAKKAAAPKAAPKKAPAKKAAKKAVAKKKASKTVIEASIDVGFGNALFIRGDAPGLSWTKGIAMECKGADSWTITMSGVKSAFDYKILINDLHWSAGENERAKPNAVNASTPRF